MPLQLAWVACDTYQPVALWCACAATTHTLACTFLVRRQLCMQTYGAQGKRICGSVCSCSLTSWALIVVWCCELVHEGLRLPTPGLYTCRCTPTHKGSPWL